MILAIDVGNSNIKIGCLRGGELSQVFRMATDHLKTEDEYAVDLKNIFEFNGTQYKSFEGAIISSVVPPLTGIFKEAVKKITGLNALIVGAGIKTGLNIAIDDPAQLGSDVVAAGVAVIASYSLPAIVFNMGTATTISVIDKKANFLGVVIVPGLVLSMNALVSKTSQLQKVSLEAPNTYIGTNTIDSMKSGAIFGTASMMDGMVARIEEELGEEASAIATGGLSAKILPHCKRNILYDENLLLRGLGIIYNKNKKK